MSNFDWTQHAKGCGYEQCSAFGKVLVRMLDHMATGEDQEGAGWLPFTSCPG